MNQQTPLEEVISFIPREVAEVLMYQPVELQEWVARILRTIMSEWETSGVTLDPVTLENVLRPVVIQLMGDGSVMIGIPAGE